MMVYLVYAFNVHRYHNPGHQMEQGHATRVEEPPLPVDEVQERRKAKAMKVD